MEHPDTVIALKNVNYRVTTGEINLDILQDINLEIRPGATIAITGVSGSGKTTLLNVMAGLDLPSSGQVFYQRDDISQLDEDQRAKLRANRIGFIFQSFHLLPNLTALENVMLPLEINHRTDARKTAEEWLHKVSLSARAKHYPRQLSGGEQQRIAIARAFAIEPEILFADEPTGNLDSKTGETIVELLFNLNKVHHTTLIIVTHDDHLAQQCQQHWPLVDGQLQC